jgi:hypothetical protein
MIYSDSRYANGRIFKANDSRTGNYPITVLRTFLPSNNSFFYYTWSDSDRIDSVANDYFGAPEMWWKIMDINPEISNAFNIPVGTLVRIPNV